MKRAMVVAKVALHMTSMPDPFVDTLGVLDWLQKLYVEAVSP